MIMVSFLRIRILKAVSIPGIRQNLGQRYPSLTGIGDLRDFQVFASERRKDQRDVGRASVFRPLRRQNPFADKEKVREKEYMSAGVSYRCTSRFGSELDKNA